MASFWLSHSYRRLRSHSSAPILLRSILNSSETIQKPPLHPKTLETRFDHPKYHQIGYFEVKTFTCNSSVYFARFYSSSVSVEGSKNGGSQHEDDNKRSKVGLSWIDLYIPESMRPYAHIASDWNLVTRLAMYVIESLQWPITMEAGSVVLMDLLWSDPTENDIVEGLRPNARGLGLVTFGPDRVMEFCNNNDLQLIVRAHECVMDGFERFAQGHLITLFSATNYWGTANNAGAILVLGRDLVVVPKLIHPLPPAITSPETSPEQYIEDTWMQVCLMSTTSPWTLASQLGWQPFIPQSFAAYRIYYSKKLNRKGRG